MDYKFQEFMSDMKKRTQEYEDAKKERTQRIIGGFCYCDLQAKIPYETKICKFCYDKAKQEVDRDQLADNGDYMNKHDKEQFIHNFDKPWEPL